MKSTTGEGLLQNWPFLLSCARRAQAGGRLSDTVSWFWALGPWSVVPRGVRLRPETQGTRVTVRQLCTLSFLKFFFFFFPFLKPGAHIEDNHSGGPKGIGTHIPPLVLTKISLYFRLQKKHVLMGETWKTMMKT